jgi:nitrogen fixation protein
MDIKKNIDKLRALPDKNKKIIIWSVVVLLGIIMGGFWVKVSMARLNELGQSANQIELPKLNIPNIDIPNTALPNTNDQTADWQTYQNTNYGFEIKYPAGFNIIQGGTAIQNFTFSNSTSGTIYEAISLWPEKETNLQKLANSFYKKEFIEKIDLFEFNSYRAAHIQVKQGAGVGSTVILLNNGFGYELPDITNENLATDLKAILSTFKFIN